MSEKSVGSELVRRLQNFTDKLDSAVPADLPDILTVRKVKLDLHPRAFTAQEVKDIRGCLRVSQAVFAEFVGVSAATIRDWEQGVTPPSGPACRLLEEIFRDIPLWRERIRELAGGSC